jgi:hypothetical protein
MTHATEQEWEIHLETKFRNVWLKACYGNSITFLYVDYIRTSQETHLWVSTVCYGDSITFIYADDVRTSL